MTQEHDAPCDPSGTLWPWSHGELRARRQLGWVPLTRALEALRTAMTLLARATIVIAFGLGAGCAESHRFDGAASR